MFETTMTSGRMLGYAAYAFANTICDTCLFSSESSSFFEEFLSFVYSDFRLQCAQGVTAGALVNQQGVSVYITCLVLLRYFFDIARLSFMESYSSLPYVRFMAFAFSSENMADALVIHPPSISPTLALNIYSYLPTICCFGFHMISSKSTDNEDAERHEGTRGGGGTENHGERGTK